MATKNFPVKFGFADSDPNEIFTNPEHWVLTNVVDPHWNQWGSTTLVPAFYLNPDPDPAQDTNADADPCQT